MKVNMKLKFLSLVIVYVLLPSVALTANDQNISRIVQSNLNPYAEPFYPRTYIASGAIVDYEKLTTVIAGMSRLDGFYNRDGEMVATNQNNVRAIFDRDGLTYMSISGAQLDPALRQGVGIQDVVYQVAISCRGGKRLIELTRIDL